MEKASSFQYTKARLDFLEFEVRRLIQNAGGNSLLEQIIDLLANQK